MKDYLQWFSSYPVWVQVAVPLLMAVIVMLLIVFFPGGTPIGTKNSNGTSIDYTVRVKHEATGQGIERAKVMIDVRGKAPLNEVTDSTGFARIFIDAPHANQPGKLTVEASGFRTYTQHYLTRDDLPLDISLEPDTSTTVSNKDNEIRISLVEATPNGYIRGTVEGLKPEAYKDYKVLVYKLTNQWYIHPYETGAEGKTFASINDDGTWKIQTVWRGHQASQLALLLTKRTTDAPSQVSAGSDPEKSLLAQINTVAHHIIDAPKGI